MEMMEMDDMDGAMHEYGDMDGMDEYGDQSGQMVRYNFFLD